MKISENIADRIISCVIGLGTGVAARVLSSDYNTTKYLEGAVVAAVGGSILPYVNKTGQDEKFRGLSGALGSYVIGYVVTNYIINHLQK
jgi:hypothetical protein